jgi:hypothetical protein
MTIQIIDCTQGELDWFAARAGIATASNFSDILAQGKGITRAKYMRRLAGERITGETEETYTNAAMERGKVLEVEARDWYAFTREVEPQQVGFIVNGRMGCSPDSLVGPNGGLEIKTAIPSVLIEAILRNDFPPEHKAQVQGSLMVTEREWWDLVIYSPKMPKFVVRATPDKPYLETLRSEIARFNDELDALVEKIKKYEPMTA